MGSHSNQDTLKLLNCNSNGFDFNGSSPHPIAYEAFSQRFTFNLHRKNIIFEFNALRKSLECSGIMLNVMLVGGSFLSSKPYPSDLDALLIYTSSENANFNDVKKLLYSRPSSLDIAVVPRDADPTLLIRRVCFFHTLYQGWPDPRSNGSAIVSFEN